MKPFKNKRFGIARGGERTVVLVPGFAIKFCFWPPKWINLLISRLPGLRPGTFRKRFRSLWNDLRFLWHYSVRAYRANRQEYRLSRTKFQSVVAKTVFSLGGFITVSRRAETAIDDGEISRFISAIYPQVLTLAEKTIGTGSHGELGHSFEKQNFGRLGDKIVLIDYGSEPLERLFRLRPNEVLRIFEDAEPRS